MSTPFNLTDTHRDVLRLIAEGHPLGDYLPRYRLGARRGRGAFPTAIAERAGRDLRRAGLVERDADGATVITAAGRAVLDQDLSEIDSNTGMALRRKDGLWVGGGADPRRR